MNEEKNNVEKAFGHSKGNPYKDINAEVNEEALEKALKEAEILHEYMGTKEYEEIANKQLLIEAYSGNLLFQNIKVRFITDYVDVCSVEFSVPLSFTGDIRI